MLPLESRPDPHTGLAVTTSDGARLGTVRETSGSYFKVDAPMHRDFWLSRELVRTQDESTLVLEVPQKEIDSYRRAEPGLEPGEDAFERISGSSMVTPEEMLEQRANMERELAEQSRNLPPHEPSITQVRGARGYERIPADHTGFGDYAGGYVPNAPVQDRYDEEDTHTSHHASRGLMSIVLLAGAAAVVTFLVIKAIRGRRKPEREHIRDHAAAAARLAGERTRDMAKEQGASARKMLARRGALVARRIEDRLQRAA